MIVKILPNMGHEPAKLADVELLFEEGVLSGLRLIGFAIWESRVGHARTVTFPARTYYVNQARRSYALLRPLTDSGAEPLRRLILQTYDEFSQAQMSDHSSASQRQARASADPGERGSPG